MAIAFAATPIHAMTQTFWGCRDTQPKDIQHNGNHHGGLNCDTTLSIKDRQSVNVYAERCIFIVMLSVAFLCWGSLYCVIMVYVILLSVVMLSVTLLNVILLNVVLLSVVLLSVVAPSMIRILITTSDSASWHCAYYWEDSKSIFLNHNE